MSVLRADVDQLFIPVVPAMGAGIIWVFLVAWRLGFAERRRLAQIQPPVDVPCARAARRRTQAVLSPVTGVFYLNAALTGAVILAAPAGLVAGLAPGAGTPAITGLHGRLRARVCR